MGGWRGGGINAEPFYRETDKVRLHFRTWFTIHDGRNLGCDICGCLSRQVNGLGDAFDDRLFNRLHATMNDWLVVPLDWCLFLLLT